MEVVNLNDKLAKVKEYWSPKIVGELNDTYVKIVKFTGEFVWHHHDNEDELFLVVKGTAAYEISRSRSHGDARRVHHCAERRGAYAGGGRGSSSGLDRTQDHA